MRTLAIDAATRCGLAIGDAGGKPRAWSIVLKRPDDDPERAFGKMTIALRDLLMIERVDVIAVEEHMLHDSRGFSNAHTNYLLGGLVAVVFGIGKAYGVRVVKHKPTEIRKHFVGQARPDDPKKRVLERCKKLGYVERDFKDTDASDAIALWDFCWAKYAPHVTRELHLFQGQA